MLKPGLRPSVEWGAEGAALHSVAYPAIELLDDSIVWLTDKPQMTVRSINLTGMLARG